MYGKTSLENQDEISNKAKIRTTRDRCERDIETVSCWELKADAWELSCWSDGATSAVARAGPFLPTAGTDTASQSARELYKARRA